MVKIKIKFPVKYVFTYFFWLWGWDEFSESFDYYLEECDLKNKEPTYWDIESYTLKKWTPSSWLPKKYHWTVDWEICNYIDDSNISNDIKDINDIFITDNEIHSVVKIKKDMLWWVSLKWHNIEEKDINNEYAIFIEDWHHRILSAIESWFDHIVLETSDLNLIKKYWEINELKDKNIKKKKLKNF